MSVNEKYDIYHLNQRYYNYLSKINKHKKVWGKPKRPFLGLIKVKAFNSEFLAPLWSNESNISENSLNKYCLLIKNDNQETIGILRLDKMIPVFENENFYKNIDKEKASQEWQQLVVDELKFIDYKKMQELANEVVENSFNKAILTFEEKQELKECTNYPKIIKLRDRYSFLVNEVDNAIHHVSKNMQKSFASYKFENVNIQNTFDTLNKNLISEERDREIKSIKEIVVNNIFKNEYDLSFYSANLELLYILKTADISNLDKLYKEFRTIVNNQKNLLDSNVVIDEPVDNKYLWKYKIKKGSALWVKKDQVVNEKIEFFKETKTVDIPFDINDDFDKFDVETYLHYVKYALYLAMKNNAKQISFSYNWTMLPSALMTNRQIAFEALTIIHKNKNKLEIIDDETNNQNDLVYVACDYLLKNKEVSKQNLISGRDFFWKHWRKIDKWADKNFHNQVYEKVQQYQKNQNKTIGITKSPATERENVINNLDQKIIYQYTKSAKLKNQSKNSNTKGENMLETNNKNQNNVNVKNQDEKSTNKSKNNFDSKYFSYVIRNAFVKEVNEKNSNKHINISLNRDQKVQVILNENAFVKYLGDKTFAVKMNDVKEIKGFSRSLSEPGKWRYEKMNSFSLQSLDCVQVKSTKELERKSSKDEIKETVVEQQTEAVNAPSFVYFDKDDKSKTPKNQNEIEKTM